LILLTTLLSLFVNTTQAHKANKFISTPSPRPNVEDLKQLYKQTVSPYYEKPYFPQEVDKLTEEANLIKKDLSKYMTNAEIIGPAQQKGVEENPIMYSTVIDSHPTSITHPTLKPHRMVLRNGGGEALFDERGDINLSSSNESGYINVIKGGSIPVSIRPDMTKNAANENFEDPVFIHKSEKKVTKVENINTALTNQVNGDISIMKDKLKVADNTKEKLRVLKSGLKRLDQEINTLGNKIQNTVKDVLAAKEVGNTLHNVLNHYETTLRYNEASKLKLVDVIEIKKQLKVKLLKEMQGIRTSDNDFKALLQVNPRDLKRVIREIKGKLGL